ncbi:MAG: S1/P1 nuclease, partial [Terriglobia bacterium]
MAARTSAIYLCVMTSVFLLIRTPLAAAWGPEGHAIIALIAEKNMSAGALRQSNILLRGASLQDVASWPDEVVHLLPATASWHYIDIPLQDSAINLREECRNGNCVMVKTEQFLSVLTDPDAGRAQKALALKFVVHFIGDLHQPLHCENNDDEGGNTREVIFEGHPDRLHWVWDTGLLREIDQNPEQLAATLERQITPQDRRAWEKGSIGD